MGENIQTIITILIVALAIFWAVKRIFFTRNKGCGCGNEECAAPQHKGGCGDCPLAEKCSTSQDRR